MKDIEAVQAAGHTVVRSGLPLDADALAFLAGFLSALGEVRVLVCGPARAVTSVLELRLPDVTFVNGASGTTAVSAEREARDSYDLILACSLSAVFSGHELQAVIAQLWRVARIGVLHLEAESHTERLIQAWTQVTPIPGQALRPGQGLAGLMFAHPRTPLLAQTRTVSHLLEQLSDERLRLVRSRSDLNRIDTQLRAAQERVSQLEHSAAHRLAERMLGLPGAHTATRALGIVRQARVELARRGLTWPKTTDGDPPEPTTIPQLPFAGIASRATPADPDLFLAQQPRIVVLCHPEWRGIRAATYGQAPHVLEVPGILSRLHARKLALFLKDAGAQRVVMNGYPPGTERLAQALKDIAPEVDFFVVFHGTPAQAFHEHEVIARLLELADRKLVKKLGFVKHGLPDYFRQRGYPAEYVMNVCRMPSLPPAPLAADGQFHVGVFAPGIVHKNVETQVIAALMVPGTVVHTLEKVRAAYLQAERHRVVEHGLMPHADFVRLLGTIHATCYVSLVECYPMTVLESIFCGAVCLSSNTSQIFEFDADLKSAFVVDHHDSPAAIATKLSSALERREELVPRAQRYLDSLNDRAERRWIEFLDE